MNIPIIRRLLWVMNEILQATPHGGISRQELSKKWSNSCKNNKPGEPLPERTFYRIMDGIKELFGCEVVCNPITKKYAIQLSDEDYMDDEVSLLEILTKKASKASINEILQMLLAGNEIPLDDMRAARDLSIAISSLPQQYAEDFLQEASNIEGADKFAKDEYYPNNYVCVWNDAVYHRTWQWLSIGFYDDEVYFYVVTNETDSEERDRKAKEISFGEGVRYRGGYYWHKPEDPDLFSIKFGTKPDMEAIRKRAELLLARLKKVQTNHIN